MKWLLLIVSTLTVAHVRAEPPAFDRALHLIDRGRLAVQAGNTLSALGYYRDAISAAPRRDVGYVALGELYLQLGEPNRALEVLQVGARWTIRGEGLWMALYEAHRALHDDARALEALRTLRRLEPSSRRCLQALAEDSERRGAFIEALAARRSLLALMEGDDAREQQTHVRALEVLLGNADIVRGRAACTGSEVARALARCR